MSDISMCKNDKCPFKEDCYRYTATPNNWSQSYSSFIIIKGKCEYFWSNKDM